MARITVDDCLRNIPNRFEMSLAATYRARQITNGSQPMLEANRDNAIVDWLVGAGDTLSQPFHGIFTPDGRKAQVAVNWGLAAVVYALVGGFIARLLRR